MPRQLHLPILAITAGTVYGIGVEVFLKSWQWLQKQQSPPAMVLLDLADRVEQLCQFLELPITIHKLTLADNLRFFFQHEWQSFKKKPLLLLDLKSQLKNPPPFHLGALGLKPNMILSGAELTLSAIDTALELIRQKQIDGIVTAPLEKSHVKNLLPNFSGHTEYLAEKNKKIFPQTNRSDVLMMLAHDPKLLKIIKKSKNELNLNSPLRVVPLTTHVPLQQVSALITKDLLITKLLLLNQSLQVTFGIKLPKIGLAGLNPHAGEDGNFGQEEQQIFIPALQELKQHGVEIAGPLPADSLFTPMTRHHFDAIACPTHDQALIPIKALYWSSAVNITLGLDFIRVSPDHGTGLDIADKNQAEFQPMLSAIATAFQLIKKTNY